MQLREKEDIKNILLRLKNLLDGNLGFFGAEIKNDKIIIYMNNKDYYNEIKDAFSHYDIDLICCNPRTAVRLFRKP